MDDQRFDELTKALVLARSRRGVLRGLAGGGGAGLLALLGAGGASAKPRPGKPGKKCKPATCQPGQCGLVDDGCGGTLDCGVCCTPATCQPGQCGLVPDDCGGTMDCNDCCFPATCEVGQCGFFSDGCGGTLECSDCCTPATCQPGECGSVADGCGGSLDCGECCTPATCQPGQCGTVDDGCGGILDCGTCCIPDSPETTCAGRCGLVFNNCDQAVECGGCTGGGCFVAGTLIAMADGTSKPIERVAVGDRVLGRSGSSVRVLHLLRPALGDRPLYAFNGGHPFVTASHPFLTEDGWKAVDPDAARAEVPGLRVGRLAIGDVLVAAGPGADERPVRLRRLEGRPGDPATQLFNLDVGRDNTYVAAGLIVHNKFY